MRRLFLIFIASLTAILATSQDGTLTVTTVEKPVIFNGTGHKPKLIDEMPEGLYRCDTRMLSIEFPSTDFEPYTLTVETLYTTLEYYVTTPLVNQYISPDAVNVNLYIETDAGDLYYGSFEATSNTSME